MMEQIAWWILTLIVPTIALVAYWVISRRQVRRATDDLEAQIEAERQVTARVSHRLRNPLTVIYGFSETLLDSDFDDREEVRNMVSILSAEALDVSRTVEDLVARNDIDRDDLAIRSIAFDPAVEVERAVLPFRRLGAEISVECWSGTAHSDPVRFRQIVGNLVSNAVRHGGHEVTIVADIEGSEFQCIIADDGDGLPRDVEARVFGAVASDRSPAPGASDGDEHAAVDGDEDAAADGDGPREPGVETRREKAVQPPSDGDTGGLGLGLGVAAAIATSLGGSLTYERAVDASLFTLMLPTSEWPGPVEPMPRTSADVADAETEDESVEPADGADGEPDDAEHGAQDWADDMPTIRFDTVDASEDATDVVDTVEGSGEATDIGDDEGRDAVQEPATAEAGSTS